MLQRLLEKFKSVPKLAELEPSEAALELVRVANSTAMRLIKCRYFLRTSKCAKQEDSLQGMYFNELAAGFIVMLKMLLDDRAMAGEEYGYMKPISSRLYPSFWQTLKEFGLEKQYVSDWKRFIKIKEKAVTTMKNVFREQAISRGDRRAEMLINRPELLIIRAVAYDTYALMTGEGRADKKDGKFLRFIINQHNEVFLRLRLMAR